jgi:hypothetical protein
MLKQCRKCSKEKPLTEFYKAKAYPDGHRAQCKTCYNEVRKLSYSKPEVRERIKRESKEYYYRNRDARCEAMAKWQKDNWDKVLKWRSENADKITDINKRFYKNHKDEVLAACKVWREQNPGKVRANNAKREKTIKQQTPPWADLKAIQKFYIYSAEITAETGIQHHVDHIIPLQGKLVSGLHVEGNLRVIPAKVNIQKSNSYTL